MFRFIWQFLCNSEVSATSYAVVFRIGFAILGGAIFAVASAWFVQRELNNRLERQIEAVNARFMQMSEEHERAVEAANSAIKARDEVYALNKIRIADVEKVLGLESGFDRLALPERLRLLFEQDASTAGADSLPATGSPAPGH